MKINFRTNTLLTLALASGMTQAQQPLNLSLEELMQVVVTSVSKKSQTMANTAAAAYVIQAEDIRRSGAKNIPEALRLAPGVQVSAIGNNKWAVSIRGQADRYSNKLLVLVDGRTVYTPLFSGVIWEALDIPLQNIDRIEILRGPGAAIWGANAVNGVINILTRSPYDMQGKAVSVSAGSELQGELQTNYGWQNGDNTAMQVYAKAHVYDEAQLRSGANAADDWQNQTVGFKLEHLLPTGKLAMQTVLTHSVSGEQITTFAVTPRPQSQVNNAEQMMNSGNFLLRWEEGVDTSHSQYLQFFTEYSDLTHPILQEQRVTSDLEYQYMWQLGQRQQVIMGAGYRNNRDEITNSNMVRLDDIDLSTDLFSFYLQDEITLQPEQWKLSVGARLEHNTFTKEELQPNARLLWTPDAANSFWLSYSTAVRTPSRIESGGTILIDILPPTRQSFGMPTVLRGSGAAEGVERLNAIDLGWRHQFNTALSVDIAAFDYDYDQLRSSKAPVVSVVAPPGYVLIDAILANTWSVAFQGWELAMDWRPRTSIRVQANYSHLENEVPTGLQSARLGEITDTAPKEQYSLRSAFDLNDKWQLDLWLRRVSAISLHQVPAYNSLDLRVGWRPSPQLELSLVGQNLLQRSHYEFASQFIRLTRAEIERGAYLKVVWKFRQ
jgi:iron complex outermembrane recepter protein